MKRACAATVVLLLAFAAPSAPAEQPRVFTGNLGPRAAEYVPDRLIVGFAESVSEAEADQIAGASGARVARRARAPRAAFRVLSVPRGRVLELAAALRSNPRVRYAHPDWIAHALDLPPNDPYYPLQWNLQSAGGSIRVEGAWAVNPGGDPGVVVAVIDTGVAYESFGGFCQAPDLAGTRFVPGWDFVGNDAHPNDDNSHGTHVAGTIAQTTGNSLGAAGVAPNVSIMPLKVLGANGSGTVSAIADAIRFAADNGAGVINMSLGTSFPAAALQEAVQYAAARGVLMFAASGNSSGATPMYPAAYAEVDAIGATRYDKSLASYSNRGNDLCAPGGTSTGEDLNGDGLADMILQNTFDPNTRAVCSFGYWLFAGTSMATPHAAAVAALVKSERPELLAAEIRQVLRDTADASVTDDCGFGLVDATRALEAVAAGDRPPTVSLVRPADGAMVFGTVALEIAAADGETGAADLVVEWSRDGGATWSPAAFSPIASRYEAAWDSSGETEDAPVTLRARATDNASQTTLATPVTVRVNNSNQAPVAAFAWSCSANVCDFDASATSDADGSALSYSWSFGDGQSGAGRSVRHSYASAGSYVVTLTATDELGAAGSDSENVSVTSVDNKIHVSDLDRASRRLIFGFWEARITIRIADTPGSPVANVAVSGLFSDGPSVFRCTTNAAGSCTVVGYQWSLPCLTFTVTGATHATLQYDPTLNRDPDGDSDGTRITVCRP